MTNEEREELIRERDKCFRDYEYWRKKGNLSEDEYKQCKFALITLTEIEKRLEGYTEDEI